MTALKVGTHGGSLSQEGKGIPGKGCVSPSPGANRETAELTVQLGGATFLNGDSTQGVNASLLPRHFQKTLKSSHSFFPSLFDIE